jgi:hypothetical protein
MRVIMRTHTCLGTSTSTVLSTYLTCGISTALEVQVCFQLVDVGLFRKQNKQQTNNKTKLLSLRLFLQHGCAQKDEDHSWICNGAR